MTNKSEQTGKKVYDLAERTAKFGEAIIAFAKNYHGIQ
jgi:hypothetical protein